MSEARIGPGGVPVPVGVEAELKATLARIEACQPSAFESTEAYKAERDRLYEELAAITAEYVRLLRA